MRKIKHKIEDNLYSIYNNQENELLTIELIKDPEFPGWIKLCTEQSVYCGPISLMSIE